MKTKFRGFSERLNKWVYGYLVEDNMIVNGIVEVNNEYVTIERWETVVPRSVGQYTGSNDLTGAEIYGDDNVEIVDVLDWKIIKGKVVFLEGAWLVVNDVEKSSIPLWSETNEVKIIGNIHENKELLEGE